MSAIRTSVKQNVSATRGAAVVTAAALFVAFGAFGSRATVSGQQQTGRDDRSIQTGTIEFVVVTRDGRPVTDLKAEEVTLRISGRARPIKTLQFVRLSEEMRGAPTQTGGVPPPGAGASEIAPPFATNFATSAGSPRSIVLIIEDQSMPVGQEQQLRAALNNFVRDLPARDLVALVTVPQGGIKVGFTDDRERLRRAIADISPISPMLDPTCRTRATLSAVEGAIAQLASTSEQPLTVALLSSALTASSQAEAAPDARTGGTLSSQAGACYLPPDDFVRVGQTIAATHAQLYIIHPDYSPGPALGGIENLRGQTGAPLFHLTSSGDPGLYRMARETSGYYIATYDTEPAERSGRALQASIRTSRSGVELRDRPYVVAGRSASPTEVKTTTVTTSVEMVRSGRQFRELPLRASTTSSRNPDGTVNVVGLFEPIEANVKIMSATAALFNEKGVAMAYWYGEADKMSGWPTAIGLTVQPGNYRLRIGAIASDGRLGLVDDVLVAELYPAGDLQVSGLVLGVSRPEGFSQRMQFTTEATAVAYLELYGGTPGTPMSVIFEVSQTTSGAAIYRGLGALAATTEDNKATATGTIPLWNLPPGDYVVRAIVQAQGQTSGRVIRTLRKVG
jgi:hypothetical protein